ncbi:hypothetical protein ARTHRO8AJ_450098 [Arthrobacter sp. 8AJ]|nr:hypothetical protein ARTHRO8AJ_450098 [Arthrobacter sp. 8AJ]
MGSRRPAPAAGLEGATRVGVVLMCLSFVFIGKEPKPLETVGAVSAQKPTGDGLGRQLLNRFIQYRR